MSANLLETLPELKTLPWNPEEGRPTWEVAMLFPGQGRWTEDEYLRLEEMRGDHIRIELVDGRLEVLPVPTRLHQAILIYLLVKLKDFAAKHSPGEVSIAGLRVRLANGRFREPDVVYLKQENCSRSHNEFWAGADLAMEIVSGSYDDRKRDYEEKVKDYAEAGIPEYWIVDPDEKRIRVLTLKGEAYQVHGDFGPGSEASSVLLPGFKVSVDAALRGQD